MSCLSAGSLTLHTRLVINPRSLGRLACASLWTPCAKHGHKGLRLHSGCMRMRTETSRFTMFPTTPYTKHRVLGRFGLLWLCRGEIVASLGLPFHASSSFVSWFAGLLWLRASHIRQTSHFTINDVVLCKPCLQWVLQARFNICCIL